MTYNLDERIDRTGRGQAKWEPAGLKEMFGDENMLSDVYKRQLLRMEVLYKKSTSAPSKST